jgi:DNA-binding transcriptional MerR regulator
LSERAHLSIGEVLSLLRDEFPDITISKIRFLESQGLLDPERTPSGYRKFYDEDVERLRWILRQQREHFLPLKVIKGRLSEADPEAAGAADSSDSAEAAGMGGPADVDAGLWPSDLEGAAPPGPSAADMAPLRPAGVGVAASSSRGARPARASGVPGSEPAAGAELDADEPARRHPAAAATLFGDRPERPPSGQPAESGRAAPGDSTTAPAAAASGPGGAGATGRSGPATPRSESGPSTAAEPPAAPSSPAGGHRASQASGPGAAPSPASGASGSLPEGPAAAPSSPGTSRPAAGRGSPAVSGAAPAGPPSPLAPLTPDSPSPAGGGARGSGLPGGRTARPALAEASAEVNLTVEELAANCGLPVDRVKELERFGLLVSRDVGGTAYYGEEAQAVAVLAAGFASHGVEARHLRMYKNAAERESGLFEQIVMPLIKQRNPQARLQAAAAIEELSRLGGELRETLLRRSLRDAL